MEHRAVQSCPRIDITQCKKLRLDSPPRDTSIPAPTKRIRLDSLPLEIIHRILAQGPCTSALALIRVNKSLSDICMNPFVYRHIVKYGNGVHGQYNDEHDNQSHVGDVGSTWWNERALGKVQDWRVCAKWALADMAARNVFFEKEKKVNSAWSNAMSFVPELLSQRHPIAVELLSQNDLLGQSPDGDAFWQREFDDGEQGWSTSGSFEKLSRAAFVYTCHCTLLRMVHKDPVEPPTEISSDGCYLNPYLPPSLAREIGELLLFVRSDEDLWRSYRFLRDPEPTEPKSDDKHSKMYWLRSLTLCTMMAGVLHRKLELIIEQQAFMMQTTHPNLRPPSAAEIPLETIFVDTPPPFTTDGSSSEASMFIARHIPIMTSSDFLTDGEWIGHWNHTEWAGPPSWFPITHGITFEITSEHGDQKVIAAKGVDTIAPFEITGTIDTKRGWIRWTSRYTTSSTEWSWSGLVTVFGIIGGWDGESCGWFWFWKRAWSKEAGGEDNGEENGQAEGETVN